MGDDVGELAAGAVDPTLRGCSIAPPEHGGDQVFDNLTFAVVIQHGPDMVHQGANHLVGRRRP
ncbi:MAG: hypothetical protein ACRDRS_13015, partial [Pseudonocardiaceae bacterium]